MIEKYRQRLNEQKARKQLLGEDLEVAQYELKHLNDRQEELEEARVLIQEAALKTQESLRVRLSSIVTLALQSVFKDEEIEFRVTFESKRGKTECLLEVGENGVFAPPLETHGGGLCDIASFALRASFWSIEQTRPVMVLDEPMKFLRGAALPKLAAEMLRMVSEKLGIQIIMVSHVPAFVEAADKVFEVKRAGGITTVEIANG